MAAQPARRLSGAVTVVPRRVAAVFLIWQDSPVYSGVEGFIHGFVDSASSGTERSPAENPMVEFGVQVVAGSLPALMIILLVPMYASLLKLFDRTRRYVEHLVFALHLHAVVFLALVLTAPIASIWGTRRSDIAAIPLMLVLLSWQVVAFRRFYGLRAGRAILRALSVNVSYLFAASLALGLVLGIVLG
ncbi:MAG: hypothetical protein WEE89_17120 [Gemmatimonadota bacterium]